MRKVVVKEKMREIVEEAARVFARFGYHKTTLEQIADRLKIAKGSLYLYFKNKKALFDAVCDYTLSVLDAEIEQISLQSKDFMGTMRKGLEVFFTFCKKNRHFVELLMEERSLSKRASKLTSFAKRHIQRLMCSLEEKMKAGILRRMDVRIAAGVFLAMILGALVGYFKGKIPFTLDEIASAMLDIYFKGVLAKN